MDAQSKLIADEYFQHIDAKEFPCVAAKAARAQDQIRALVVDHLACPKDDRDILHFLYGFVEAYRSAKDLYHSAVVIFKGPGDLSEELFDQALWARLQAISDLDAQQHRWDARVSSDPAARDFSFSIGSEAFYVIGLHPNSSRKARQFRYPSLVFNPHEQFEELRESKKYLPMRDVVRKRDIKLAGSINPMLADFGESSEAYQYSGKKYDQSWKCPFVSDHDCPERHTTP